MDNEPTNLRKDGDNDPSSCMILTFAQLECRYESQYRGTHTQTENTSQTECVLCAYKRQRTPEQK